MPTAQQLIHALALQPHPEEGGYFRETYRAADRIPAAHLPDRYGGDRHASTAIYYLLTHDTFSALHRLKTDEVFHYYAGNPLRMLHLYPDGRGEEVLLGPDVLAGQRPQVVVPRGVWQGAAMAPGDADFALIGCTVAPGFEYVDYEHGARAELLRLYPAFRDQIARLTQEG